MNVYFALNFTKRAPTQGNRKEDVNTIFNKPQFCFAMYSPKKTPTQAKEGVIVIFKITFQDKIVW